MKNEDRVAEILEVILETDCDPTLACAQHPELLAEVRRRLDEVRRLNQRLDELFPHSDSATGHAAADRDGLGLHRLPTIAGYEVEAVLGSGGMGVVYRARHQKLNRVVALKMLRAGQLASSSELTRFAREFQAIAELHCPHIVQIHDVGDADGRPYFTMEFVDGGSLAERLLGEPQPARQSAELVATLAEAIHSAHSQGIIHRDLKPANILLSRDGCLKIADFGLARHMECDHPLTVSGVQLGTPSYMAPEQATGAADSLGPAVDVYALGAILYEMLTGRPPFRAESLLETQRQVIQLDPVPPARINASVPRDLETICLHCLNKQPDRRYASAGALAEDLHRFLRHEPIHARPIGPTERMICWMRRNPALTAFGFAVGALVCLAAIFIARETSALEQRRAETQKWRQRLEFVTRLEEQGRFTEARAILGRVPDGGSSELRDEIQRAQRDLDFVEQLDAIRMSRGKFVQGGGIDYDASSRQYAAAFEAAGIGSVDDLPSKVVERLRRSTIGIAIVAALDDWAACATAETRGWILEVARLADPDPWRDQVRQQSLWADTEHLERLAETVDIPKQPVTLLVAMGTRWRRLGGNPVRYLERVHHVYPDDFWLNFELAILNAADNPAVALAHDMAALAARPNAAAVHFNLGVTNERLQRAEQARFHLSRTLELDPMHTWAEYRLAINLFNSGSSEEALNHFQNALAYDSDFKDAKNGLRMALVKLGRFQEAMTVWQSTLDDPNATHADVDGIAELYLFLGHEDGYHRACEIMLKRFGETTDALECERLGRSCLLKPKNTQMQRAAAALVERALSVLSSEQQWARPYIMFAESLSAYRQGDYERAITKLEGDAASVLPPAPELLMAMSFKQLNQPEKSQEYSLRAQQQLDRVAPAVTRESWLFEILRREALNPLPGRVELQLGEGVRTR